MKTQRELLASALLCLSTLNVQLSTCVAQGTTFTYQGRLTDYGAPANGRYDFRGRLFDAPSGGTVLGTTNTLPNIPVSSGLFTVHLDFGDAAFVGGGVRWLELAVRTNGAPGDFSPLNARQPLTPAPMALSAGLAGTAYATAGEILRPPARFAVDWFTVDGGGVQSADGRFTITGTAGQPDAGGPLTTGQFSVTGGFWAMPALIQTTNAPTLHITNAAPGFATICWTPPTPWLHAAIHRQPLADELGQRAEWYEQSRHRPSLAAGAVLSPVQALNPASLHTPLIPSRKTNKQMNNKQPHANQE